MPAHALDCAARPEVKTVDHSCTSDAPPPFYSLQRLLNDNGFAGDLPSSFYSSIPPGSELMKWLVTSLDSSNFVQPADMELAAEYSKARQALEQDRADLCALADQGAHGPHTALQEEQEWLSVQVGWLGKLRGSWW